MATGWCQWPSTSVWWLLVSSCVVILPVQNQRIQLDTNNHHFGSVLVKLTGNFTSTEPKNFFPNNQLLALIKNITHIRL
jgi:hypothetical protein